MNNCRYCNDESCPELNWRYGLDHILPDYEFCPMCGRRIYGEEKPLTLDELRKMEGTPVWIRAVDADEIGNKNTWGMVYFDDEENGHATVFWFGNECEDEPKLSDYGKTWTAYRHKPEVQTLCERENRTWCRDCPLHFVDEGNYSRCKLKANYPCDWEIDKSQLDQSAKSDANKPRPTLIDMGILRAVSKVRVQEMAFKSEFDDIFDLKAEKALLNDCIISYAENPKLMYGKETTALEEMARFVEVLLEATNHSPNNYNRLKNGAIPFPSLTRALTAVREYGVKKYTDPENWRHVEPERYRDALWRHWLEYLDDENSKDEESGLPHLWHVACNIMFLIALEDEK